MLSFKEISLLREQLLTEAYDYKQMFTKAIAFNTDPAWAERTADRYIEVAQTTLKKNFRIIWFLKLVQWFIMYNTDRTESGVDSEKYYSKLLRELGGNEKSEYDIEKKLVHDDVPRRTHSAYQHYLDLNINAINDFNPQGKLPSEVFSYFEKLEAEWAKELEGTIKYTDQPLVEEVPEKSYKKGYSSIHDDPENYCLEVINFGDGWYWVDLDTDSCDLESKGMGHCGSSGNSGSTLLSLRYLNKRRKDIDSWVWEPHVTFELEEDHMLGQMKGKNNDKPSQKYHDRIIALLTHKTTTSSNGDMGYLIKGLRGGGYRPETNFSLDDLTSEQQDKVIEENPNLDITNLVLQTFGEARVKIDGNIVIISKFPMYSTKELCLSDLYVETNRNDSVSDETVTEICSDGYMDTSGWNIPYRNVSEILSGITVSPEHEEKIIAFLDKEYPDWKEDADDWEEYVRENNIDEVEDVLQRAYLYAKESAIQDDAMEDFYRAIRSSDYIRFDNWDDGFSLIFNKRKDSGLLTNLVNHDNPNSEDSYDDKEVFWTWDQPRYGWQGSVNSKEFNEQLAETIGELG